MCVKLNYTTPCAKLNYTSMCVKLNYTTLNVKLNYRTLCVKLNYATPYAKLNYTTLYVKLNYTTPNIQLTIFSSLINIFFWWHLIFLCPRYKNNITLPLYKFFYIFLYNYIKIWSVIIFFILNIKIITEIKYTID
jgi:hypothetical protein